MQDAAAGKAPAPLIFISYRRSDTDGHAGRLYDRLSQWFDTGALFYDKHDIDMGDVFPDEIEQALDRAVTVLVVIGPGWVEEINRRVAVPDQVDYVRLEAAGALARRKLVIPVYLGGAQPSDVGLLHPDLQAELAGLGTRNAHVFQGSTADWDNQFRELRNKLAALPGVPEARFRLPAGAAQPRRMLDHQLSAHFRDSNALLPQLHVQLKESGGTALVARAALYGMGGVGKTQLALKYCLDYPEGYAGIWWFRAETETTLQLDADACCKQVGAAVVGAEPPSAALKRWFAAEKAPWLLVYDNAENVEALRPHLPQGGPHRVVVTSRDPAWGGLMGRTLQLDAWTPEQGADFLADRLPGRARAELQALAEDLGGLPLALEQAAGYVESTGVSIAEYRRLLATIDTEGLILDEGRAATGYERSVLATLSLAFDRLSPAASLLLRLLAFAAPEPLPERFLREAADALPVELAAALRDDLAWPRLTRELRTYSLADRTHLPPLDPTAETDPALHLHRLTQQTLRTRLAKPEEDCRRLQDVLVAATPEDAELPANWPRLAALLPHATQLDRYLDVGRLERRWHTDLLDRMANYLRAGPSLYAESIHWFRRALEIDRTDLGDEHLRTLGAKGNLALTLNAQGDLTGAFDLQKSVLETFRRVLGDEHPETLSAMTNLAITLKAQGDLASALDLEKSVLAARRRALGDEHPSTLTAMNNLAETFRTQGDLTGAFDLQKSVLETFRRVLGDEHPDTLTSMNNLALILKVQDDLAGALELEKSALAACRRILGDEHPDTLASMGNLANTLLAQGDLASAFDLQQSALAACRRALGDEHPHTLTAMNNLACTLQAQGDLAGALNLQKSVLATRRHVLGEAHPDTIVGAWNLFISAAQLEDEVAAQELLDTFLLPLLQTDPTGLSVDLQNIHKHLLKSFSAPPSNPSPA